MTNYIEKNVLAAEINRLIKSPMLYKSENVETRISVLEHLLSFLDTIEVKEMDLEKEVEDWVKTGPHTSYPWCTIPDAIRITAEHFFELGLKAQKGV